MAQDNLEFIFAGIRDKGHHTQLDLTDILEGGLENDRSWDLVSVTTPADLPSVFQNL